ncbi:hypothetical protein FG475_21835 [Vibrio navarrensis]|nr:hypothetical protein [Vibrio navarrensis]
MKVYRGPKSKPFWDNAHEFVSRVSSKDLEAGIRDGKFIKFNITKEGYERQAVCTAKFEKEDLIPMMGGLLSHLSVQQKCLSDIVSVVKNNVLSREEKMKQIEALIEEIE